MAEFNRCYGKQEKEIREVFGGTVGYTYEIGDYFLKVYDRELKMAENSLRLLDRQLRILAYLQNATALRDRICYPIPAADGSLFVKRPGVVYTVFNRIAGKTVGWERDFTPAEEEQLIGLLTDLHAVDVSPIFSLCPRESFDLSWLEEIPRMFRESLTQAPAEFARMSQEYGDAVEKQADAARSLAASLRSSQIPYVLCHTDAHAGNLMAESQGRMILIDWENMILAPKEADLFMYGESAFFSRFPEASSAHPLAMRYYTILRDLADIWDFYRCILYEPDPVMSREEIYDNTLRIIQHLKDL